jgi:hypothetical protein
MYRCDTGALLIAVVAPKFQSECKRLTRAIVIPQTRNKSGCVGLEAMWVEVAWRALWRQTAGAQRVMCRCVIGIRENGKLVWNSRCEGT